MAVTGDVPQSLRKLCADCGVGPGGARFILRCYTSEMEWARMTQNALRSNFGDFCKIHRTDGWTDAMGNTAVLGMLFCRARGD